MSIEARRSLINSLPFGRFFHKPGKIIDAVMGDELDRFVSQSTRQLQRLGLVQAIGSKSELVLTGKYLTVDRTMRLTTPGDFFQEMTINNVQIQVSGTSSRPRAVTFKWDEMGYSTRSNRELIVTANDGETVSEYHYNRAVYDVNNQLLGSVHRVDNSADQLTMDDRERMEAIIDILKDIKPRDIRPTT